MLSIYIFIVQTGEMYLKLQKVRHVLYHVTIWTWYCISEIEKIQKNERKYYRLLKFTSILAAVFSITSVDTAHSAAAAGISSHIAGV